MGYQKYVQKLWEKPAESLGAVYKQRMIQWRKEEVTVRADNPTRPDKARRLGYRAKQGVFIVRQRLDRGGRQKPFPSGGRRSKRRIKRKTLKMNYQWVAEQRANDKYPNCEVLNSYFVGKDGSHFWYELIMVDRNNPTVLADPILRNIASQRGRSYRGLTSAGRRSRALHGRGKGYEKARPSLAAHGGAAK